MRKRVFLIHATRLAIEPIRQAFETLWPDPVLSNLLEDSLSSDLERDGRLTDAMIGRFKHLARYAESAGADAILFTCSAFGPAIEAAKAEAGIPVLKPNEAMIELALEKGRRIGLVASFAPSLPSLQLEFEAAGKERGVRVEVRTALAEGAFQALGAGRVAEHDSLVGEAVKSLEGCDAICFAQFSLQSAASRVRSSIAVPLFTTPDSAVLKLKSLLA